MNEINLGNYDLGNEIYISKDVNYAIKNKWEPLLFPEENHVFLELLKDNLIFRVVSSGPILLEHIRNGTILENHDGEKIRTLLKEGKEKDYTIKVRNNITFEVLEIQSRINSDEAVVETVMIKDGFYPGSTMPYVISNFLKHVQQSYQKICKK